MPERVTVTWTTEVIGVAYVDTDLPCECGSFGAMVGSMLLTVGQHERVATLRLCAGCERRLP